MASIWPFIISTARKFSSRASLAPLWSACAIGVATLCLSAAPARACPFCNAVLPSFAQTREAAEIVALGEVTRSEPQLAVLLRGVLKGQDRARAGERIEVERVEPLAPGSLCLLLATTAVEPSVKEPGLVWTYRPVTETSYAYFARAPELRVAGPERLRYFARYLEHPDANIAADAYLEFGHAPFDVVAQAADSLPLESMRRWIVDENVPQERKGFYGLALGLAREARIRGENAALLARLVREPADDFRAGFGGILSGYLLAAGEPALDLLDERFLAQAGAADGDVRSALAALRFYHEFGKEIPHERLRASLRHLVARQEFAAEAIVDLARWQDWGMVSEVARFYDAPAEVQPSARRAAVGYLSACPLPAAAAELAELRARDPRGVGDAEAYLKAFGALR
ncbi:MAG: hypothetical protein JNG90_16970 [Planctomycetaceae bacterium]|nr:hypothetical protein [Planctomycetaceae bacterium]